MSHLVYFSDSHLNSWVVDVLPVPERGWSVPGHQVVLWHEGEEPASAERVPRVPGHHVEVLHALPHLHVFCARIVFPVIL